MVDSSTQVPGRAPGQRDRWSVVDLPGPLGRTVVLHGEHGLVGLRAWNDVPEGEARERWLASLGAHDAEEAPLPDAYRKVLVAYAEGAPVDPASLPVELRGPAFYVAVWRVLRMVKRGAVCTYRDLASGAGSPRAMRAVGRAMAHNPLPIVVPCHRVIAARGAIGGYTGGLARKRVLLGLEGVSIQGETVRQGQLSLLGEPTRRGEGD